MEMRWEAQISGEACAPTPTARPPVGRRTHQSSSTTRTSTKNVFLLTRFLNVSAKGENFSYVEPELKKQLSSRAGVGIWGEGYPPPDPFQSKLWEHGEGGGLCGTAGL